MTKTVRSRYTLEFKQEAVRLVQSGQSMAAVSRAVEMCQGEVPQPPRVRRGLVAGKCSQATNRSKSRLEDAMSPLGRSGFY